MNPLLGKITSKIRQALPDVEAIYCFGSFGTSWESFDSDIDIAILPAGKLNPVDCWELAQSIASFVNRDVDLIDLHEASTVMRYEIIATGKRLYYHNKSVIDAFENFVFSSYVRFNDSRQELLDDIQQRGQVT